MSEGGEPRGGGVGHRIGWGEVAAMMKAGRVLLVDARPRANYDAGHIPGAVSLSVFDPDDQVRGFVEKHGTNVHVVAYCGSAECPWAGILAGRLEKEFGVRKAEAMATGYVEWQAEQATSRGEVAGIKAVFPVVWAEVKGAIQSGEALLVDVRPAADFDAGHITGAVHLPHTAGEAEIAAFRGRHGAGRRLVLYCVAAGCLQAHELGSRLVNREGFERVETLREGYWDWQRLTTGRVTF